MGDELDPETAAAFTDPLPPVAKDEPRCGECDRIQDEEHVWLQLTRGAIHLDGYGFTAEHLRHFLTHLEPEPSAAEIVASASEPPTTFHALVEMESEPPLMRPGKPPFYFEG